MRLGKDAEHEAEVRFLTGPEKNSYGPVDKSRLLHRMIDPWKALPLAEERPGIFVPFDL